MSEKKNSLEKRERKQIIYHCYLLSDTGNAYRISNQFQTKGKFILAPAGIVFLVLR